MGKCCGMRSKLQHSLHYKENKSKIQMFGFPYSTRLECILLFERVMFPQSKPLLCEVTIFKMIFEMSFIAHIGHIFYVGTFFCDN